MLFRSLILIPLTLTLNAQALVAKTHLMKAQAEFVEEGKGVFKPLDLKSRVYNMTARDLKDCEKTMLQEPKTFNFSCVISLENHAGITKLHYQNSPSAIDVPYADKTIRVTAKVDYQASKIIYSTEFDAVGIDFDTLKFNEDFQSLMNQSAINVIEAAMKAPLRIEVFESRR